MPGMTLNAVPDTIISLLLSSTILFVLWSPNRWFILRRFLVIYGSLMALRTVCILATSLPDAHPHCRDATPGHTPFTQMQLRCAFTRCCGIHGGARRVALRVSACVVHAAAHMTHGPIARAGYL